MDHYTHEKGLQYYRVRERRRNPKAQAESAALFAPHIDSNMTVLDFGCGTGGILAQLACKRRLGVEINEMSIAKARENGIEIYATLDDIPDGIADAVITHHALEHVEQPFQTVLELTRKLKEGGRIVIVVPAEEPLRRGNDRWRPGDDNNHLYCWNALALGNLMQAARIEVIEAFIVPGGYSRYIAWARNIPVLYPVLNRLVAKVASRYSTVGVGLKPTTQV